MLAIWQFKLHLTSKVALHENNALMVQTFWCINCGQKVFYSIGYLGLPLMRNLCLKPFQNISNWRQKTVNAIYRERKNFFKLRAALSLTNDRQLFIKFVVNYQT